MQCSIPSVDSGTDNQLRLIYLLLFYTITKVCRVKVPWEMFSRMAKPNLYTAACRKYLELWIHWKNQRYLNWEHFYEGIARHLLANSQYCISLEGFKMVLVKCTRTLHAHAIVLYLLIDLSWCVSAGRGDLCWLWPALAGGLPLPPSGHAHCPLLQVQVQQRGRWPVADLSSPSKLRPGAAS